jgi:hydrogenase nickel incorporation protein HypA/HybF
MHEWGLARDLVEDVLAAARVSGAARVSKVRVRIGSMSGVSTEAFQFAFEAASSDTIIRPGALEIHEVVARSRCAACGRIFEDRDGYESCPGCGGIAKTCVEGKELVAESIGVEDDDV